VRIFLYLCKMEYIPKAFVCPPNEFNEVWDLWDSIPPTPNPMNKNFNIRRRQSTFGGSYAFAGQVSSEIKVWPTLVSKVLEFTKKHSGSDLYNVVHVNWYPDGSAGLEPHSDDMRRNIPGMSIYSFTFLSQPGNPRGFQIYDKKTKEQTDEYMLDHGDLVIMTAGMQDTHKHGIKKSTAKKFKNLKRLNMTVRAWN